MEDVLRTQPYFSTAMSAVQRSLVALFLILSVTLIIIYVVHKSEKARKFNIPGIPLVTGPWFGDFRKALEEANAKVRIAMHADLEPSTALIKGLLVYE